MENRREKFVFLYSYFSLIWNEFSFVSKLQLDKLLKSLFIQLLSSFYIYNTCFL